MQTEREYRLNFLCFEISSYVGIIPFKIRGGVKTYPAVKRLALWLPLLVAQVLYHFMAHAQQNRFYRPNAISAMTVV